MSWHGGVQQIGGGVKVKFPAGGGGTPPHYSPVGETLKPIPKGVDSWDWSPLPQKKEIPCKMGSIQPKTDNDTNKERETMCLAYEK